MTDTTAGTAPAAATMPDIGAILAQDTGTLHIKGPDGKPLGWTLTLAGPGHSASIQLEEEQTAWARERARMNAEAAKEGRDLPEESVESRTARLTREFQMRIVGWNPVTINGQAFEYSPENAHRLMSDRSFSYVQAQVVQFFGRHMAFTAPSAKN